MINPLYKDQKEAKLTHGVSSESNSYLWERRSV